LILQTLNQIHVRSNPTCQRPSPCPRRRTSGGSPCRRRGSGGGSPCWRRSCGSSRSAARQFGQVGHQRSHWSTAGRQSDSRRSSWPWPSSTSSAAACHHDGLRGEDRHRLTMTARTTAAESVAAAVNSAAVTADSAATAADVGARGDVGESSGRGARQEQACIFVFWKTGNG